ncbi:MAG: hypothetical protein M1834_005781 [Cirrosporium novae-zelandiae]|nr:MAG: hypothetical protein M1834_005781 [Cirrosporium novae-zelandiae]
MAFEVKISEELVKDAEILMAQITSSQVRTNGSKAQPDAMDSSNGKEEKTHGRIAHTLTACCRCRQRKAKCDVGLPRCGPCERTSSPCEYYDTSRGKKISRTYIIHLEKKVRELEEELSRAEAEDASLADPEVMVRSAGLIKFKENEESRFLGPSSGIAITRLVMDFAKKNMKAHTIKDIVPDTKAKAIKDKFKQESQKPTSKVYPLTSSVAAPHLPKRELTDTLVAAFNVKAQYMLPTLHEPTFRQDVEDVYNGSPDAYQNFIVRMVIAISLQKHDIQYAGLADSYYVAALPYMEDVVKRMDLGTLQCFALIAQYSMVTPTRTAAFWVIGLAARLCQELRINDEATITHDPSGTKLNPLQVDMRRRLFWIITSMEFGLSHSLGRPSAFGISFDHINVGFFEPVDDRNITANGVIPGSPPIMKKRIAIHFFKMRLLQAEMRRMLYLKKRPEPQNDQHSWFIEMEQKIRTWKDSCPKNDEGSGLSDAWFQGRLNTMIVLLFRPSPQIPNPSVRAAKLCFEASRFNIYLQHGQIAKKSVDLTWIFTQSMFMALNTLLWSLSYPEVRHENPKEEVTKHLETVLEAVSTASERWPGVTSALMLYRNLINACLKAYDEPSTNSQVGQSPCNGPTNIPTPEAPTPPPLSTASTHSHANSPPYFDASSPPAAGGGSFDYDIRQVNSSAPYIQISQPPNQQYFPAHYAQNPITQPNIQYSAPTNSMPRFNPSSFDNQLPSTVSGVRHWDPSYSSAPPGTAHVSFLPPTADQDFWLSSIGDQYSQYLHAQYSPEQQQLTTLDFEQQHELMENLEMNGLPELSYLKDESATFFSNNLVT